MLVSRKQQTLQGVFIKKFMVLTLIFAAQFANAQASPTPVGPGIAASCDVAIRKLKAHSEKRQDYDLAIADNYIANTRFLEELYSELTYNEGKSLYIPYGTYESVQNSVVKLHDGTSYVAGKIVELKNELI